MSDKPIRWKNVGFHNDRYVKYVQTFDNDPDFDELIAAAQEVVETGLQSSDGRHCIVPEDLIDRLRKALEPRSEK